MFILASSFDDEQLSKRTYDTIYTKAMKHRTYQDLGLSCYRILVHQKMTIVVFSDKEESAYPPNLLRFLQSELSKGTFIELPADTIEIIKRRRAENQGKALKNYAQTGRALYENHSPQKISYEYPVLQNKETKEVVAKYYDQGIYKGSTPYTGTLPSTTEQSTKQAKQATKTPLPFLMQFQEWSDERTLTDFTEVLPMYKDIPQVVNKLNHLILQRANKYLFTSSALRMHQAVLEPHRQEWIPLDTNMWIELVEPLETAQGTIKAMFLSHMNPQTEIEIMRQNTPPSIYEKLQEIHASLHGKWGVQVLGENTEQYYNFAYDESIDKWVFLDVYECPTDECQHIADMTIPCEKCKAACRYWASWARTSVLMISGEYATSPEPKPFNETTVSYDEDTTQVVGKGKNRRVIGTTKKREVNYVVIAYDVSTVKPTQETTQQSDAEKRQSWLSMHSEDEIIYERRRIEEYERRYQKQEGTYRVEAYQKYVPMLRERKTQKITKIVASEYENK